MPDADGNVKGSGWSRKRAEGWERAFTQKHDLTAVREVMAALHERIEEGWLDPHQPREAGEPPA